MILDRLNLVSGTVNASTGALTGQSVNGAGTFVSTDSIDLGPLALGGNQVGDLGAGERVNFEVSVTSAPTVGASVQFAAIQADDAALTVNVQILGQSTAYTIAQLPVGTLIPIVVDQAAPLAPKRFVGVQYINVGAIATAAYAAALVKDVQSIRNLHYRSGYGIA